ncbi:MAG: type II toxin-antitoxin system Phd/YefM family antitoxin [Oscillospiraceae bacterium]|nr:type II toxin-antitoxin system Phd/YefM family antitoxin [Oscillospiraceae bacterium]
MSGMSFVSFRELRTSTAKINDMLTDNGKIVVTSNGKPKAVMIQVNENDFEETLAVLNQIKLTKTINNMRASAERSGAAEMTLEEINAEIALSRNERQKRKVAGVINA